MIKLRYIVFIMALSALVSCKKEMEREVEPEAVTPVPVTVIKAEISDYYEYGEYYGRTSGVHRASIINILGGTVESVGVVEGVVVKDGDSLASISRKSAEIALESATLNEKISSDNYQTLKDFLKSGNSTPKNVDQARLTWLSSQSTLIDARKAYNAALAISPIDGVVVERNINVGDEINPGTTTFLIEDLSHIEIQIGIPEADMNGIKEGSPADITFDLYPGRIWHGKLTRFSRRSSDQNLTFTATIQMENSDGTILSGITAKVDLLRNSYEDSVILPSSVIVNENGSNYVMALVDNRAEKRDVILGVSSVERCLILSGVEPGDILIDEGVQLVVDSQPVSVMNKEQVND